MFRICIQEATDLSSSLEKEHYAWGILRFPSVRADKFRGNTETMAVTFKHFAISYETLYIKNELTSIYIYIYIYITVEI